MVPLERLIAMGVTGTGKTMQWLDMARTLNVKGGPKFYCIDTDNAVNYMIATSYPDLDIKSGGNVEVFRVADWEDYHGHAKSDTHPDGAQEKILKKIKPNDWIIIDMADTPWETVQRFYTSEIFGKPKGAYLLQVRRMVQNKLESGDKKAFLSEEGFKGWEDWSVINAMYADFMIPIINNPCAHLYLATKVQALSPKEDPTVKVLYGDFSIRASGQKNLGHAVHTILLYSIDISTKGKPVWKVTTVKDRANREYFTKTEFISFYWQYLVAKAGWASQWKR